MEAGCPPDLHSVCLTLSWGGEIGGDFYTFNAVWTGLALADQGHTAVQSPACLWMSSWTLHTHTMLPYVRAPSPTFISLHLDPYCIVTQNHFLIFSESPFSLSFNVNVVHVCCLMSLFVFILTLFAYICLHIYRYICLYVYTVYL
jgi:hypothetical protein